jgi:hypothetical protein
LGFLGKSMKFVWLFEGYLPLGMRACSAASLYASTAADTCAFKSSMMLHQKLFQLSAPKDPSIIMSCTIMVTTIRTSEQMEGLQQRRVIAAQMQGPSSRNNAVMVGDLAWQRIAVN